MSIRRGTTPTIKMSISGIELSTIEKCYVTLEQPNFELTKEADLVDDHYEISLDQEETLQLGIGVVRIQMKIKTVSDTVLATNIVTKPVSEILNEEII